MKVVGYDKWLDIKVEWDEKNKFDVLYQRDTDDWVVIDTFITQNELNVSAAISAANGYIEKVEKEMLAA